ncbi:GPP34 family phosphoprotein [Salinibacterium sp. SWN1162]|uniref:GPP34 family phosphoprotein n=1 Tax=Salinibacterium sp. SWN1162 TaxID=2792053 RepID=UPI0018CD3863|nr:GPP34 family phosphoprotein [Salinibacterium sp. SWN1162]MBH0008851.1 GPP34 family phosphoprotein [Salinibacterium sp. SWN1162]
MASSSSLAEMAVAEKVQLMLGTRKGRLEFEGTMTVSATLIELALLGRISSIPNRALFAGGSPRKILAVDSTPTGDAVLDAVLIPMSERGKPWVTHRCMFALAGNASRAVHARLESRGLVQTIGTYPSLSGYLEITDHVVFDELRAELGRVRSTPEQVSDPRTGAFIDVLRNGVDSHSGEQGLHPYLRWEWYPAGVRATVQAILQAERIQFTAG